MIFKVSFIAFCLVFFAEANKLKNFYVDEIVKEVCKGFENSQCSETVKMCIPPFKDETLDQMKAKHCSILETCLDKVTGARPIYDTYIKVNRGGREMCTNAQEGESRPKPIGQIVEQRKEKKESFEDFLVKNSGTASMTADFKCCVANEKGKFNDDRTVNVASWKEDASRFVDSEIKTAFENGVDACAAATPVCNVIEFKICAISKCYEAMKHRSS